jgi:hypothetical protein
MSALKKVAAAGQQLNKGVQAAHGELPIPQPPAWAGYWTFTTAVIIFAFILYVTKKGTVGTWLGFFSWSTPKAVGTTGAPSNSQSPVGQLLNGPTGNASIPATTPGQANAIPWGQVGSGISSWWNSFINPNLGGAK